MADFQGDELFPAATSTAADVAVTPAGTLTATDVQAALEELDTALSSAGAVGLGAGQIPFSDGTGLTGSGDFLFRSPSYTDRDVYINNTIDDKTSFGIFSNVNVKTTSTATKFAGAFFAYVYKAVKSGVGDAGYITAISLTAYRNHPNSRVDAAGDDSGVLQNITGINIAYGHRAGFVETPVTNKVYGAWLFPRVETGTVGTLYDIYISTLFAGGTVTNRWSIYQEDTTTRNFFGSKIGVGVTDAAAQIHAIKTTEQLRLGYDATKYLSATVDASGNLTLDTTGGTINTPDTIENTTAGEGIILKSPDGTRYKLTVANGGTLSITAA